MKTPAGRPAAPHLRQRALTTLTALLVGACLVRAAAPAPRGGVLAGRGLTAGVTEAANNVADALGNAANNLPAAGETAKTAVSSTNVKNDQSNSLESNTLLTIINKAFDADSGDMIDPENGTMKWKGHTYELSQVRLFRARFERFLALSPNSDQQAYQALINRVFFALATNNAAAGKEDNMKQTWQLLFQAAEYEADGGTALDVANQVFNTWRVDHEQEAQRIRGIELERVKELQQRTLAFGVNNAQNSATEYATTALKSQEDKPSPAPANSGTIGGVTIVNNPAAAAGSNNGGGSSTPNRGYTPVRSGNTSGAGTQLINARHLIDTEATLAALQVSKKLDAESAKLQFQAQVFSLFMQRKFQHAIIAASFYRFLFKGSDQNLDPKFTKTLAEFVPGAGDVPFTVGMIEQLSREALNEVRQGMAAVRASYADQRLVAALQRLEESFFLGEFLSEVAQLEPDKRQKLYALYLKVDQARKLADLKDYDAIIKLNAEIGTVTKDFRSAEVTAAARTFQQFSQLALAGAKQAIAAGDFTTAQTQLAEAAKLWPLNPDITAYGNSVSAGASLSTQAAFMFDDAFKHSEFRRIYDHRDELVVGFANDPKRAQQFKGVMERMGKVELALIQAQEAVNQSSFAVAWDALAAAAELVPNDPTVNQRKAELAPRVADYVGRPIGPGRPRNAARMRRVSRIILPCRT